jgi:CBS domain-containing protein
MAKTAREVMTQDAQCVGENDSVLDAAKRLAELDVGAMPICGEDDRLKGMLTDRDSASVQHRGSRAGSRTRRGLPSVPHGPLFASRMEA